MAFLDSGASGSIGRVRGLPAAGLAAAYDVVALHPGDGIREGAPAVPVSLLVSSTGVVDTDVRVEVATDAAFTNTIYGNTLVALGDGVHTVTVSGLIDLTQYWLRVRAAETGTTGWTAWTVSTFTIDLNAGRASHYVYLNAGPAPFGAVPAGQYVDLNVGVIFPDDDGAGQQYVDLNVGFLLIGDGVGYGYVALGDVDESTPVPHIWFLKPAAGRPGDGIRVYGFGFGDTPAQYSGVLEALIDGEWVGVDVTTWQTYPASADAYTAQRMIDTITGAPVDPQHTRIEFVVGSTMVPPGVPVRVRTDGP